MLNQAGADHPKNVGDRSSATDTRCALEVGAGKIRTCSVDADEDVLDFDGAGVQHGLQNIDGQRNTIAGNPVSSELFMSWY